MATASCVDCPTSWVVDDATVAGSLATGVLREHAGPYGSKSLWGVCDSCQLKHRRATPKLSVENELVRLRELVVEIRAKHPEWPIEQVTHEAVEVLNNPRAEPDKGFRAYLLQHDF